MCPIIPALLAYHLRLTVFGAYSACYLQPEHLELVAPTPFGTNSPRLFSCPMPCQSSRPRQLQPAYLPKEEAKLLTSLSIDSALWVSMMVSPSARYSGSPPTLMS